MNWSLAIHIIGIVFWTGGLLITIRFLRLGSVTTPAADTVTTIRKTWQLYIIHGLGLTLLTGLFQLFYGGVGTYMKQGWFHGKLTLVIILVVATVICGIEVKKLAEGKLTSAGRLRLVQILTALSLIGIVFLTKAVRYLGS